MAIPQIMHVKEKERRMGPFIRAPYAIVDHVNERVKYGPGDAIPLAEAVSLGLADAEVLGTDEEPAPRSASARGRKVRLAQNEVR